jgi:hypothetical protein
MAVLGLENGDSLLLWDGRSLNMESDPQPVAGAFRRPVSRQGPWSRTKPLPGTQLNRSEPLTTKLVGYWPFNEGSGRAQDLVSGHHGIFSGGASWQNRNASFNGSTSVVTCAGAQSRLRALPLSITVWFQAASAHNGTLVQYAATSFSQWLKLSVTAGGSLIWAFAGTMATSTITAGTYTVGRWHCATALSRSDSLHELYLDGNLVGTSTTTVIYPTLDQCTFGYAYDWMMGWSENFSGQMAAVAVHSRALSRPEIQQLRDEPYRLFRPTVCQFLPAVVADAAPATVMRRHLLPSNQPPLPGTPLDRQNHLAAGLTSYWPLNETAGAIATDLVTGKQGTLSSGASWRGGRLRFDQSTGSVTVTGAEQRIRQFPISISAWFRADSLHFGALVGLANTALSGISGFQLALSNDGTIYWFVNDGTTQASVTSGTYQVGAWVHVVGVSRGLSDHALYVNGQLAYRSSTTLAIFPTLNAASLGRFLDIDGWYMPFNGLLGPCAIYSRALLPEEITQLAVSPFALLTSRNQYYSVPVGIATGSGGLLLEDLSSVGAATQTAPNYDGSGTLTGEELTPAGAGTADVPVYSASVTLATQELLSSGSADALVPVYSASVTLALQELLGDGSAESEVPVYAGAGTTLLESVTPAGSATLTPPEYSATITWLLEVLVLAGSAQSLPPVYDSSDSLSVTTLLVEGASTHTVPAYSGSGSLTSEILLGAGSGLAVAAGYAGLGFLLLEDAITAATASFAAPVYSGTGSPALSSSGSSGDGTLTVPAYSASGTPVLQVVTPLASGDYQVPTATGSSALSLSLLSADGSSTVEVPVYAGSATLLCSVLLTTSAAVFQPPVFVGSGSPSSSDLLLSAAATFFPLAITASALLTLEVSVSSGSTLVAAPVYSGGGTVALDAVAMAGACSFYLSQSGIFADLSFPSAFD